MGGQPRSQGVVKLRLLRWAWRSLGYGSRPAVFKSGNAPSCLVWHHIFYVNEFVRCENKGKWPVTGVGCCLLPCSTEAPPVSEVIEEQIWASCTRMQ